MDTDALVAAVRDGDVRLHELEQHGDPDDAAAARRRLLAADTGADLETVGSYAFDAALAEPNIENMLGAAQVPMGVVGPITVSGGAVDGDTHLPLATTEGALVASVNRGCAAIRAAGGATARVLKNGMTRAPVFRVADVAEASETASWVRNNVEQLAEAAESTTGHGELRDVTPTSSATASSCGSSTTRRTRWA